MGRPRKKAATDQPNTALDNAGSYEPDHSGIRPEDKLKDMAANERKAFMRRRVAEEKEIKQRQQVVDYYYQIMGKKLLRIVQKGNGAKYSFYAGNIQKHPEILQSDDVKQRLKR